jgi:hypothetical protein
MFDERIFDMANEEVLNLDFIDNFMMEFDMIMQSIERHNQVMNDEINVLRFAPNEEVRNMYMEENERKSRNDHRFQEVTD